MASDNDEFEEIVDLAEQSPTRYSADSLANVIGLDFGTREMLRIHTVGSYDVDKDEREALRARRRAASDAARRAAVGATPRHRCKARTKPWLAVGMSRSAWYRAGKPTATSQGVTP